MHSNKTILVTGCNGQLGNEMKIRSINSTDRWIFTDVGELDITDAQAVREIVHENEIQVIVNCAAYTNVEKAEEDQTIADRINRLAVQNLAKVSKENQTTLIHISTDYVFQGNNHLPYREDDPTHPLGVYGTTKLAGEEAIHLSGCHALIFRTAWLYSSFGNNFVKTMLRLTAEKESLKVVFDQVGTPTYAADLAGTICRIIQNRQYEGAEGIYHFSNEGVCSWYDFAHEIARLAGHSRCSIQPCYSSQFPSKVKRPSFSVLDKTKVKEQFQITIPHWRDALEQCLRILILQTS